MPRRAHMRQDRQKNLHAIEAAGFSKATKARLDGTKLKSLGWRPLFDIEDGVKKCFSIFDLTGRKECEI